MRICQPEREPIFHSIFISARARRWWEERPWERERQEETLWEKVRNDRRIPDKMWTLTACRAFSQGLFLLFLNRARAAKEEKGGEEVILGQQPVISKENGKRIVDRLLERRDKDPPARPESCNPKVVECWSGRCNPCLNRAFFCRPGSYLL